MMADMYQLPNGTFVPVASDYDRVHITITNADDAIDEFPDTKRKMNADYAIDEFPDIFEPLADIFEPLADIVKEPFATNTSHTNTSPFFGYEFATLYGLVSGYLGNVTPMSNIAPPTPTLAPTPKKYKFSILAEQPLLKGIPGRPCTRASTNAVNA